MVIIANISVAGLIVLFILLVFSARVRAGEGKGGTAANNTPAVVAVAGGAGRSSPTGALKAKGHRPAGKSTPVGSSPASVVGRFIFYNSSYWDGNDPGANASDDGAIATDKTPLMPGGTATFANYTSYVRGINGIMIDIDSQGWTPTVSDFRFKAGNDSHPDSWVTAPTPSNITVRAGAGVNGSDRVSIIWVDNAIEKRWLQVTVKATSNTGLSTPDVFYWGNAIGETGNSASNTNVTPTDMIGVRNNPHTVGDPALIDDVYDFNRDRKVGPTDAIIARNNGTNSQTALRVLEVGPLGIEYAIHLETTGSPDADWVTVNSNGNFEFTFGGDTDEQGDPMGAVSISLTTFGSDDGDANYSMAEIRDLLNESSQAPQPGYEMAELLYNQIDGSYKLKVSAYKRGNTADLDISSVDGGQTNSTRLETEQMWSITDGF